MTNNSLVSCLILPVASGERGAWLSGILNAARRTGLQLLLDGALRLTDEREAPEREAKGVTK